MKRKNNKKSGIKYDINLEPIILSKPLLDQLLQQDEGSPADLIALYVFYYYTAKWQKTNQPKPTTSYAANGLEWGMSRLRRTKKILIHMRLIEDITTKDITSGKVTGHYIKVNFIWGKETTLHETNRVVEETTLLESHPMVQEVSNEKNKSITKN